MFEEAWGVRALGISVLSEVRDEAFLRELARLRKTVEAFPNLEVEVVVVKQGPRLCLLTVAAGIFDLWMRMYSYCPGGRGVPK